MLLKWPGHPGDFHEFRVSYLPKCPRFLNRRDRKRLASMIKRGLCKMRRGVMRQLVRPPSPLQAYDSASEADTTATLYISQPPDSPATTNLYDYPSPAPTNLDYPSPAPTNLYYPSPAPTNLDYPSPASTRYSPSEEDTRQRFTPETNGEELVPETPPDDWHD
jgi:hypothetical protein